MTKKFWFPAIALTAVLLAAAPAQKAQAGWSVGIGIAPAYPAYPAYSYADPYYADPYYYSAPAYSYGYAAPVYVAPRYDRDDYYRGDYYRGGSRERFENRGRYEGNRYQNNYRGGGNSFRGERNRR